MTEPFQHWTVLPHGKLVQIDENILTVVGETHMPLMDLPRRMTVVRLVDASMVVFSAIALDEDEMSALEAFGRPAYLVVPSDEHWLDANTWKHRYPEIQVVAPEGAREKVEESSTVSTVAPHFNDPNVQSVTVPGTRGREAPLVIRTPKGTTIGPPHCRHWRATPCAAHRALRLPRRRTAIGRVADAGRLRAYSR